MSNPFTGTLKKWQLSTNPFIRVPPSREIDRHKVFTGRELEIDMIMSLAKVPRGIFFVWNVWHR